MQFFFRRRTRMRFTDEDLRTGSGEQTCHRETAACRADHTEPHMAELFALHPITVP